jgi:glycine cleavage system H protein
MADDMTFVMGKCPAVLPGSLRYARNHLWCRSDGNRHTLGFTSYATRLMRDVYFLTWSVSPGDAVQLLQQIGHVETSKAESDIFTPMTGILVALNSDLLDDPSLIDLDPYSAGWLFEIDGDADSLMSVAEYHQFLADNWEKTQRLFKGKMNEE